MTTLDLNVFTNFSANTIEQLPIFGTLHSFGTAFIFLSFRIFGVLPRCTLVCSV